MIGRSVFLVKRCAFIPDWRIEQIHPAESDGKVYFP
jgi:hypothetical protein